MKMKWIKRSGVILLAILLVPAVVYHFGLRNWCLRWGATPAEVQADLFGDDLFPNYDSEATHAITVHASPQKIWLWLMQIGQDRSGFYSYTFLENAIGCEMPRVHQLMPAWQPRAVGETVWFGTPKRFGGQARMITAMVTPNLGFVMVMPGDWRRIQAGGQAQEVTWSFTLHPLVNGDTRLIARLRNGPPPTLASRLTSRLFWEPAHFVMERKMLRTIRDLAEAS